MGGLSILNEDDTVWLKGFAAEKGRPLRVLHVGNVANNAYLNAKFLRRVGIEADVLCADYYHVMGCPEWEELELARGHRSDFDPIFDRADLRGYSRPGWFFQGPLSYCIAEISRRHSATGSFRPNAMRRALTRWVSRRPGGRLQRWIGGIVTDPIAYPVALIAILRRSRKVAGLYGHVADLWPGVRPLARAVARSCDDLISKKESTADALDGGKGSQHRTRLAEEFVCHFPHRPDRIKISEIEAYELSGRLYERAFQYYDIIQAYGTSPVFALVAGGKPYVAFEHGTLRDFTMGDQALHRLTALAYRNAAHTFVTNGDCLQFAKDLGIQSYSAMIHPVDVEQHRTDWSSDALKIKRRYNADVLLVCPLRHDWAVKGTDVHLRALPSICRAVEGRVVLVTASWGNQLEESRRLVDQLGCDSNVVWVPPFSRIAMIKLMQAADVVLDQMALPHFGATAPQAIAAGVPVISSYRPESTSWIVSEPAPILPAFTPDEVAAAVSKALDPAWRDEYKERARSWTDKYHSPARIIRDHVTVYRKILTS